MLFDAQSKDCKSFVTTNVELGKTEWNDACRNSRFYKKMMIYYTYLTSNRNETMFNPKAFLSYLTDDTTGTLFKLINNSHFCPCQFHLR